MPLDNDPDFEICDDYFIRENGETFAGRHLIAELWGAQRLDDPAFIETTLVEAAKIAGATVLHSHIHTFDSGGGVTGVVLLSESHISIHTWPERDYAAIDIFMCGSCDPSKAEEYITGKLLPKRVSSQTLRRGKTA